jgi:predicted nucleotide-binding protein
MGRARQNVILELGYFMGRLGRTKVCALYKGAMELPSDYQGILYVEMDRHGAWRAKLAQELVQAKLSIDLTALIGV